MQRRRRFTRLVGGELAFDSSWPASPELELDSSPARDTLHQHDVSCWCVADVLTLLHAWLTARISTAAHECQLKAKLCTSPYSPACCTY